MDVTNSDEEAVNAYLEMLKRLEPDIVVVDDITAQVSIAVSLKRIADILEKQSRATDTGARTLLNAFAQAIGGNKG